MLIGSYTSILSTKRRSAVPKKFLTQLGDHFIMAKWYEGCLVLVKSSEWEALLKKLTGKMDVITSTVRDTDRFIMGSAYECEPDRQGRVIIPKVLVEYAHLGKKLIYLGLGKRVEIWDEENWIKREKYVSMHAGEFIEQMSHESK